MKRRWAIYIIVGILFGIFDFYYPKFIPQFSIKSVILMSIVGVILNFGIWLVPAVPVILYEAKISKSRVSASLASILTWCVSVIVYYLTNTAQLVIGSSTQPDLRFSNHDTPSFWANWKSVFVSYILSSTLEWIIVAVIGGIVIGFLVSAFYLGVRNKYIRD